MNSIASEPRLTRRALAALAAIALFAAGRRTVAADEPYVEAGKTWLALIDQAQYGASWDQASAYFRGAITKADWEKALGAARAPLGTVKSRELQNATHATTLPGAPDGNYQVMQFRSSFQNKAAAVETLTMMLDAGQWKAAGYFIK